MLKNKVKLNLIVVKILTVSQKYDKCFFQNNYTGLSIILYNII